MVRNFGLFSAAFPVQACACCDRFHVDDMSSAHVYLRMPDGQGIDDISPETLDECCQLVKVRGLWHVYTITTCNQVFAVVLQANSIQGCKMASVLIVRDAALCVVLWPCALRHGHRCVPCVELHTMGESQEDGGHGRWSDRLPQRTRGTFACRECLRP